MPRGEIKIDEELCLGCGICAYYCKQGCIELSPARLTAMGRPQAIFKNPEKCTACSVCAWMCPHFAIEVYKLTPVER